MYFRKTYFKLDHYFLARPKPIQRCCPYIVHRIPCHRNLIRIISDSSSYMAVPIRATIDPDPVLDPGADLQHDLQRQHEDHVVHLHDPGSSPEHLSLSLDADRNLF